MAINSNRVTAALPSNTHRVHGRCTCPLLVHTQPPTSPNKPRQPLEIPDRRHMCDCSMLCRLSCKPGHTRVRPALCISTALAGPQAANEVHWGAHSLLLPAEVSSTSLQLPVGTHTLQHNLAWTRYCRMCMNKAPATMQIDGYGMPHEHRHTRHLLCCAAHTLSPRDPSSHPLP